MTPQQLIDACRATHQPLPSGLCLLCKADLRDGNKTHCPVRQARRILKEAS